MAWEYAMHWFLPHLFVLLVTVMVRCVPASAQPTDVVAPLRFTENLGQVTATDGSAVEDVLFVARAPGMSIYLRRTAISFVFERADSAASSSHPLRPPSGSSTPASVAGRQLCRLDLELSADRQPDSVVAGGMLSGILNYHLGAAGRSLQGARSFTHVTYHGVAAGVDLVVKSGRTGFKYDVVVHPGADISRLALRYVGALRAGIQEGGGLQVITALGSLTEQPPVCYLTDAPSSADLTSIAPIADDGTGRTADGFPSSRYRLDGYEIGFDVAPYDHRLTLVVDPELTWSTYLGGSGDDHAWSAAWGNKVRLGRHGMLHIGLTTASSDFPTTPGVVQRQSGGGADAAVVKLGRDGALLWATYLGGSGFDGAGAVAADNQGAVVVGGSTAGGLPVGSSAHQSVYGGGESDGFLAKLDSTGNLVWLTYLGGAGEDWITGVAIDRSGNIALTLHTESQGLASPGARCPTWRRDALVARFSPTGVRRWASYSGGAILSGGICTDSAAAIYVTGEAGLEFTPTPGAFQHLCRGETDAIVMKFAPTGDPDWATFLGGSGSDAGLAVCVGAGRLFVTGSTGSGDFPTTTDAFQERYAGTGDAFIAAFTPAGLRLWSTFYGGSGADYFAGVGSDATGNIAAAGTTTSLDFPLPATAWQRVRHGGLDATIVRFSPTGRRLWASYLGGRQPSSCFSWGSDVAVEGSSAIVTGFTQCTDFVTTHGAIQRAPAGGGVDLFITRFCMLTPAIIATATEACRGDSITISAPSEYRRRWSTGDTASTITVGRDGPYWYRADDGSCSASSDTVTVRFLSATPVAIAPAGPIRMCPGSSVKLDAGARRSYRWSTGAYTRSIVVSAPGRYSVTATDERGCSAIGSVDVLLRERPVARIEASRNGLCLGDSATLTGDPGFVSYRWSTGDTSRAIRTGAPGTYTLTVTDSSGCASVRATFELASFAGPPLAITPQRPILCPGDSLVLTAPQGLATYHWSTGASGPSILVRAPGRYRLTAIDTNGCRHETEIHVEAKDAPRPRLTRAGSITLCDGDPFTLGLNASYAIITWSDGSSGPTQIIRRSGIYHANVRDEFGCPGVSDTLDVQVLPRPEVSLAGAGSACAGTVCTYRVEDLPGVGYTWRVEGGALVGSAGANVVDVRWDRLGGGRVEVTAYDIASLCGTLRSMQVLVGTSLSPEVHALGPVTFCPGDSVRLDAGPGYEHYRWNTGALGRWLTVGASGEYTVEVRDVAGCTGRSVPVQVRTRATPIPVITSTTGGLTMCAGESLVLDAGPWPAYRWSTGETTRSIAVREAGSYRVSVSDTVGCSGASEAAVVTTLHMPGLIVDGPTSVCVGGEGMYDVGDSAILPVMWRVQGGELVEGQGSRTARVRWGAPGIGFLEARHGGVGCRRSGSVEIRIADRLAPRLSAAGRLMLCSGDSLVLSAPAGYLTYRWSTEDTGRMLVVRNAGSYWVAVSAPDGCRGSSDTVEVRSTDRPRVRVRPERLALCAGDSAELDAGEGFASYLWTTGEISRHIMASRSGTYSVRVTSAAGCAADAPAAVVSVAEPVVPTIAAEGEYLVASEATAWQWLLDNLEIPGAVERRLRPEREGRYRVRTVDANGCSALSEPLVAGRIAEATVALPEITARPGDRLSIPIRVLESRGLDAVGATGFTVTIRFRRTLLLPVGATPIGDVDGMDRVVMIRGIRSADSSGPLAVLEMIAALGDTTGTRLHIESFKWDDARVSTTLHDGLVRIRPEGGWRAFLETGELAMQAPAPNPAHATVRIRISLAAPGRTLLVLYDELGRQLDVIMDRDLSSGCHEITYDTRNLAAGAYRLRLVSPTAGVDREMTVVR